MALSIGLMPGSKEICSHDAIEVGMESRGFQPSGAIPV